MQVRAIALGYGGPTNGHALRQPGEVFEMDDEIAKKSLARKEGTWFEAVDGKKSRAADKQEGEQLV